MANLSKELPPNLDQSSSGLVLLMALITIPIPIAITRCAITVPLNLSVPKKFTEFSKNALLQWYLLFENSLEDRYLLFEPWLPPAPNR